MLLFIFSFLNRFWNHFSTIAYYARTHVRACTHKYVNAHWCTHAHIHTNMYIHACPYAHMTRIRIYAYTYRFVNTNTCLFIPTLLCAHKHTQAHTHAWAQAHAVTRICTHTHRHTLVLLHTRHAHTRTFEQARTKHAPQRAFLHTIKRIRACTHKVCTTIASTVAHLYTSALARTRTPCRRCVCEHVWELEYFYFYIALAKRSENN